MSFFKTLTNERNFLMKIKILHNTLRIATNTEESIHRI